MICSSFPWLSRVVLLSLLVVNGVELADGTYPEMDYLLSKSRSRVVVWLLQINKFQS
jgi:hypothetical protein